ncbi:MAG: valine--tRNA ligase [Bacilli bacterium]|nr:valine--tRNA ligase [Bacilli bacterium]
MELAKSYSHVLSEEGKFDFWKDNGYFDCDVNSSKKPFSMIVPPPNVTGHLHIGHALNTSILDIISRYKKLMGYDVEFTPGTDHAGIATQAKVEALIKKDGIDKYKIGREEFLKIVWKFKEDSASYIHDQWKCLGIGMDYKRERFTLDEKTDEAVKKVFKELYDEGLIYQGERIINWDPILQTALSNIEVIHKDIEGKFYYFRYHLYDDPSKYFVIATTRPETMFGDVCVVFNPNDERYKGLEGKYVINPANGEKLIMIADRYVDIEFGTGLMKCTPAHDPNDFEIAKRHKLSMPLCMNKDGTMNELAHKYQGMDRYECREALVKDIEKNGDLEKIENIVHSVGHSERSDTVVEPYLSKQWFIKMKPLAEAALKLQNSEDKINFYPKRFNKIFKRWLEEVDDWCISRQLWWGHRIPIYYSKKTGEIVCSLEKLDENEYYQDEDVLDTWFSSALSPFALQNWPDVNDPYFKRYYPTSLLVTAYDIIFFWVARMAFQAVHFTGKMPFKDCFIHGLVRDEFGRKMSKSLGNGIDPIDVVKEYGVDSLRYALATTVTPGLDMSFGMDKIRSASTFLNKIWNASRYILINLGDDFEPVEDVSKLKLSAADQYLYKNFNSTIEAVKKNMDKYELGQASKYLYNFIYDIFCSNYIEFAKIDLKKDEERVKVVKNVLYDVLKRLLIALFPFTPFIAEDIYLHLPKHKKSIYEEEYPSKLKKRLTKDKIGASIVEMIKHVRQIKVNASLEPNYKVDLSLFTSKNNFEEVKDYLSRLCFASSLTLLKEEEKGLVYFSKIGLKVSYEAKKEDSSEINKRIEILKKEIERSSKMLNNPAFVKKAPEALVNKEREKLKANEEELAKYLK